MNTRQSTYCLFLAITLGSAGAGETAPPRPKQSSVVGGNVARLAWDAFQCAAYAEVAGDLQTEHQRLFQLGYDNALRFLQARQRGEVSEEEVRNRAPLRFMRRVVGPNIEFMLGRIYEGARDEALQSIEPAPSAAPWNFDRRITDRELRKLRAANEYSAKHCRVLR